MADKKAAPGREVDITDVDATIEVDITNKYGVFTGRNMAASSWALQGRPRFVTLNDKNIVLRTKQEAYRLAAWLVVLAEKHELPDEDGAHDFDLVIASVEQSLAPVTVDSESQE